MDQWIIGAGVEDERDYIVHTREPRFIAMIGAGEALTPDAVAMDDGAGQEIFDQVVDKAVCVVAWLDPKPSDEAVDALLNEAAVVLEIRGRS